jgi:hypothetical protein
MRQHPLGTKQQQRWCQRRRAARLPRARRYIPGPPTVVAFPCNESTVPLFVVGHIARTS